MRVSGPGLSQIEFGTALVPKSCTSAARRSAVVSSSAEPEHAGGIRRELCAPAAVPAPVRRLEIDEVGGHLERVVERLALQRAPGLGLEREDGVPRLGLVEPLEPGGAVLEEEVGEHRVVGLVPTIAGRGDGSLGREETADRLHVVAQVDDSHRQRDRVAADVPWKALAVPALERAGERLADARPEIEPHHEHVGHFAARREVVHRPLVGRLLKHLHDRLALVGGTPRGRVLEDVAHHLGGVPGVVDERLGPDRDLVAEQGGDLVRMTGAADVTQERDPVGVRPHVVVELRLLAQPAREEAGAQLRLERLAEGVVLRERQRGDELGEAE